MKQVYFSNFLLMYFDIEYNTLYLVNENDYYNCNTTNYFPLVKCNKPFGKQRLIYTLSISKYLPYPNLPEFNDGNFYYFTSTSSGRSSDIDQRYKGLCHTKQMKLIINVQKHNRYYYYDYYEDEEEEEEEERQQQQQQSKQEWPIKIIAKRMNLTFIDPNRRFLSFSSFTSMASRNCSLTFVLLVFCLLTKLKL